MSCPVWFGTVILGDILASFAFGIVISLVPIIIGLAMGVAISSPVVFAIAVVLAALCFAALGNVFSIPPTNLPATVNMIASVVKFPVVFISGIFISLNELPAWAQGIAYISPLTYFTDIARHSMQSEGHLPVYIDLLALLAFTLLFLTVAVTLHQRTMPKRI
jgi:ABC-2 type transport system permease protein